MRAEFLVQEHIRSPATQNSVALQMRSDLHPANLPRNHAGGHTPPSGGNGNGFMKHRTRLSFSGPGEYDAQAFYRNKIGRTPQHEPSLFRPLEGLCTSTVTCQRRRTRGTNDVLSGNVAVVLPLGFSR